MLKKHMIKNQEDDIKLKFFWKHDEEKSLERKVCEVNWLDFYEN